MKKWMSICLSVVFVVLFAAASCAESAGLPSADFLLKVGGVDKKIEVRDSLQGYLPFGEPMGDLTQDLTLLILQRETPLKEFTAKKVYPPFDNEYTNGFEDDFKGVDIGKERVWLRGDIMSQIPDMFLAKSFSEANYLIVAETIYDWDGTITVVDYKNSEVKLPEFKDAEEMIEYFTEHPREVDYMTYYPKFGCVMILAIYETKTGKVSWMDYKYTPSMRFARNPEAAEKWHDIEKVGILLDLMNTENSANMGQSEVDRIKADIEILNCVPQEKRDLWMSCMDMKEYSTATHSVNAYYWSMVEELKGLDSSLKNRENYDLIIQDQNRTALGLFANYCDYSGFERSVSSIEASGDYIASPDQDWLEDRLQETVSVFAQ